MGLMNVTAGALTLTHPTKLMNVTAGALRLPALRNQRKGLAFVCRAGKRSAPAMQPAPASDYLYTTRPASASQR
nr:hypothetical protein [Cronobacter turicensis]